jgi:D-tyrosyl-tRNA(Tyr) deacylase
VLLGVAAEDDETDASVLCQKLVKLRIFTDENDKMNLSVRDVGGEMLVVSQFTLLADTSHGNRPSFIGAGDPAHACALYERFIDMIKQEAIPVQSGRFGADMEVSIINDGPVTLILDSKLYRRDKK